MSTKERCKSCRGKGIVVVELKKPGRDQGTYEVQQCADCDALHDNYEAAAKLCRATGCALVTTAGHWFHSADSFSPRVIELLRHARESQTDETPTTEREDRMAELVLSEVKEV